MTFAGTETRSVRFAQGIRVVAALALLCGWAQAEPPKAAHETIDAKSMTDDLGIFVPVAVSHPGRRYPATMEFPTGPDVGERIPEFTLTNQNGETIDFHADRGTGKAVVVFYRSAVW